MEERAKSASEAWLEARAPGFQDLPDEDRRAIFDFAFLWSLFEAEIMEANARADRITEKVDAWAAGDIMGADLYDAELAYFRDRYFADDELTYHYPFLNLRKSDHSDLVEAVIRGANNDPRDRILALLMIVWRLRNNLFHGAKWAYQIKGQRENFTQANAVLMRVLERHGQLA
ncbi:hypothetical protein J3E64_003660 [Sphingobium sp. OAS761]|uniref:hypothetical protein n=1 Tax=Sphingobium sp. OAS761 TaxID=2817901 RepID=UPI00209EC59E|nr:hypothetical protein [Sphingobium sp. OAS761]MCP1471945.1 hypothetical protein [Sphingobium sp. OAS761]